MRAMLSWFQPSLVQSPTHWKADSLCHAPSIGELPSLCPFDLGKLAPPITQGEWSQQPDLTNQATIQAYIQVFELALPNIYPIYNLLECMKGLALCNHRHSISMNQDNSRISRGMLVRVQHWWSTRSQRPWTWPTTHYTINICKESCLIKRVYCMIHFSFHCH